MYAKKKNEEERIQFEAYYIDKVLATYKTIRIKN